jgi:uncharacterized protein
MIFGRFNDGSGYVFNNEHPNGVKYLTSEYYKRFLEYHKGGIGDSVFYKALCSHGLLDVHKDNYVATDGLRKKTFTVWFHVSNACNLSCKYCYIPNIHKDATKGFFSNQIISIRTAKSAINKLFDYCLEEGFETLQLKFAGGEPLLAKEVLDVACSHALYLSNRTGISLSYRIVTNGVILDDHIIDLLTKYKFGISISLDGGKYSHDKIRFIATNDNNVRGGKKVTRNGTWNTIVKNIDSLIAYGVKPYILCTVTLDNHNSLAELVAFCSAKGIGVRFSLVRDKKISTDLRAQEQILETMRSIYVYLGDHFPVSMPIERFARFAEWNMHKKKLKACGVCESMLCIDNGGEVSSCQMYMEKGYGNVNTEKLSTMLSAMKTDPDNHYLIKPQKKNSPYKDCDWKFVCAGGCPEHTRTVYNTIDSKSPWCFVYKELLPVYIEAIAKQIRRAISTAK